MDSMANRATPSNPSPHDAVDPAFIRAAHRAAFEAANCGNPGAAAPLTAIYFADLKDGDAVLDSTLAAELALEGGDKSGEG